MGASIVCGAVEACALRGEFFGLCLAPGVRHGIAVGSGLRGGVRRAVFVVQVAELGEHIAHAAAGREQAVEIEAERFSPARAFALPARNGQCGMAVSASRKRTAPFAASPAPRSASRLPSTLARVSVSVVHRLKPTVSAALLKSAKALSRMLLSTPAEGFVAAVLIFFVSCIV